MTVQELAIEIRRLSLHDRLILLDVLTSSLHEELTPPARGELSAERLYGILRTDGSLSDNEDISESSEEDSVDEYTEYLMEKYI